MGGVEKEIAIGGKCLLETLVDYLRGKGRRKKRGILDLWGKSPSNY